jgi:predicted transglutaminase-like cysteine proteinase
MKSNYENFLDEIKYSISTKNEFDSVIEINKVVNRNIQYAQDIFQYGMGDYWATPEETLTSHYGDCEDFCILKYTLLKDSGFKGVRMLLCRIYGAQTSHMVVLYKYQGVDYVLDNENPFIIELSKREDIMPIIAFDNDDIWLMNTNNHIANYLEKWYDVSSRINHKGVV